MTLGRGGQVLISIAAGVLALVLSSWLIASSPIRATAAPEQKGTLSTMLSMVRGAFGAGSDVAGGADGPSGQGSLRGRGFLGYVGRSLLLFGIAVTAALVIGTLTGLWRGLRITSHRRGLFAAVLGGLPTTLVAAFAAAALAYTLGLFPVSGFESIPPLEDAPLRRALDIAAHLALPALVLMVGDGNLRDFAGFAEAGASRDVAIGFPRLAAEMGIRKRTVVAPYLLTSSLVGVVASLRSRLPLLLGGTLVTETVFSINGLGYLFVSAIERNDVQLLGRITVWFILITVVLGTAMDWLSRRIVPVSVWKNVHAIQ